MTYQDALNKAKEKIDSLDAELILGFIQNQTRDKCCNRGEKDK